MRGKKSKKPAWWLLYASVPLMVALLVVESQVKLPPPGHQLLQLGVVVFTFALMALWINSNQGAILNDESERIILVEMLDPSNEDAVPPAPELPDAGWAESEAELDLTDASSRRTRYN